MINNRKMLIEKDRLLCLAGSPTSRPVVTSDVNPMLPVTRAHLGTETIGFESERTTKIGYKGLLNRGRPSPAFR